MKVIFRRATFPWDNSGNQMMEARAAEGDQKRIGIPEKRNQLWMTFVLQVGCMAL